MSFARRFLVIFVPLLFIPFAYSSPETDMFKNADSVSVSGSARIRWEVKDQLMDSNEKAEDKKDFIGSRFRLELKFEPDSKSTVYIQPQFTKFLAASNRPQAELLAVAFKTPDSIFTKLI